jgi:hypothetical protein
MIDKTKSNFPNKDFILLFQNDQIKIPQVTLGTFN